MKLIRLVLLSLLTVTLSFADSTAHDTTLMRGCDDAIYRVRILKFNAPENGTVMMNVENVLRGDMSRHGKTIEAFWDSAYPDKNSNWVIMVRPHEDGFLHVSPDIRYDVTFDRDKEGWVQGLLAP